MTNREHSLDAARGTLMILGVFLHAANIYAPGSTWLVVDSSTHPAFGWLIGFIHAFRMHAFFWISGYFTSLVFVRAADTTALASRLQRLLLPLIFTWLVVNSLQDLLVYGRWNELLRVPLVYHLWFLFDLVLFTVLGFLAFKSRRVVSILSHPAWQSLPSVLLASCFVAFAWLLTVIVRTSSVAYVEWFGLSSLFRLATYAPWFLLGAAMYFQKNLIERFASIPWALLPVAATCVILITPLTAVGSMIYREIALLLQTSLVFCCVGAALGVFRRLFRRSNKLVHLLSDSAYTIYLLHQMLVVGVGMLLLPIEINIAWKYCIVVTTSIIVSIGVHILLVKRFDGVSLALNGKRLRKERLAPVRP